MEPGDVVGVLNDLIETSLDGEAGFRTCAANAARLDLRRLFEEKAARCKEGAAELQALVRRLGGDPEHDTSASGAAHRFWLNVRARIGGRNDHAILEECERGEDAARQVYENALRQDLPPDMRDVVERQYREVAANHERVKALRNQTA